MFNNTLLNDSILALINLITSAITAITGIGGGMILIAMMPMFLSASIIIPVHGASQLASNASRVWFGRKDLDFKYVRAFCIGAGCGAIVFGIAIQFISLEMIPLFIGLYILLMQWSKAFNNLFKKANNFYLIAFIQMGTALFVGISGPMNIALLNKKYTGHNTVVTTGAFMTSIIHAVKILIYSFMGFSFLEHWRVILMMIVFAIFGSWIGIKLRRFISSEWLKKILPWILTLISIRIIIDTLIKLQWI